MPQFYLHYTSRESAQQISASGKLQPRRPGQRLYLSEDFYNRGADAVRNLGIWGKPVELACVVPAIDVDGNVWLSERGLADPAIWDEQRNRTGGGSQYYTYDEIDISRATWLELFAP